MVLAKSLRYTVAIISSKSSVLEVGLVFHYPTLKESFWALKTLPARQELES